jgi:metal-responsive CopG/Arc/MetJ family transcriptional regulator|tara:strand:- start:196 stop:405 length:210 start_codon:yes stop_codon:yes gene_type:complete
VVRKLIRKEKVMVAINKTTDRMEPITCFLPRDIIDALDKLAIQDDEKNRSDLIRIAIKKFIAKKLAKIK